MRRGEAEPDTKIVDELPQMRREAVQLVRQTVSEGRRTYVLVYNRGEGNAPLEVQGLVEMLEKLRRRYRLPRWVAEQQPLHLQGKETPRWQVESLHWPLRDGGSSAFAGVVHESVSL